MAVRKSGEPTIRAETVEPACTLTGRSAGPSVAAIRSPNLLPMHRAAARIAHRANLSHGRALGYSGKSPLASWAYRLIGDAGASVIRINVTVVAMRWTSGKGIASLFISSDKDVMRANSLQCGKSPVFGGSRRFTYRHPGQLLTQSDRPQRLRRTNYACWRSGTHNRVSIMA